MDGWTIGGLAREAGVGVETIRFYQRRGLLSEPPRPATGYRRYPTESLRVLRFVRAAKELGFTLSEISELLDLLRDQGMSCGEIVSRAQHKRRAIDARIAELERIQSSLDGVIARCQCEAPDHPCPVMDSLPDMTSGAFCECPPGCGSDSGEEE